MGNAKTTNSLQKTFIFLALLAIGIFGGESGVNAVATKSFSMQAKRFEFVPSTITVTKGDAVELTVTSQDVTHGLSISEFGVNETIPAGESKTITFVASQAGTFSMVCSVFCGSGHGSMSATLVVEEESEQSNKVDAGAPTIPQNLSGTSTASKIDLSWSASTDSAGVSSYVVYRNGISVLTPTSTSASDVGLTSGTTYSYQVTALDQAGNESGKSSALSISTLPLKDETAPTTSNVLETQVSTTSAKISWTTDEKSVGQVEYGVQVGSYTAATPWEARHTTGHSVELSGLQSGSTYFYRIKNTDENSNLGFSTERQFTTATETESIEDRNAPKISLLNVGGVGENEATVTFQTNEPAKAFVEFGTTTGDYTDSIESTTLNTAHTLLLRELVNGTIYYYRVKATDAAGNFEFSSQQIFTTVAAVIANTNGSAGELEESEAEDNLDDLGAEEDDGKDTLAEDLASAPTLDAPVLEFVEVNLQVVPIEKVLVNAESEDENAAVSFSANEGEPILLKGKTIPDATVTLRIRSDPFEVTTISDAAGNWSYTLTKPLEAGEHTVEIAVRNQEGEESSFSDPIRFEVEAADQASMAATTPSVESNVSSKWNAVIMIVVALLLGLLGFGLHYLKQRLKPPASPEK